MSDKETSLRFDLDFLKIQRVSGHDTAVVPVVVQDAQNQRVLMLGYMNDLAYRESVRRGVVVFWSTSRNQLWVKGESSGNVLRIVEIRVNCEQNSLLILASQQGDGTCHVVDEQGKHYESCFYRRVDGDVLGAVI